MAVICAFLYLDGVKGEAQDANYEDHIELQSFSWGASNNSSYSEGTGPGIGTGQIHNMSFSKFMCKASTELMKRVIKGLPISSGAVKLCKRNGDDVQEYYTCNLEDVVVTQYNFHAGNNGELATESFSLDFVTVKPNYVAQANDGSGAGNHGFGWNCQKNQDA